MEENSDHPQKTSTLQAEGNGIGSSQQEMEALPAGLTERPFGRLDFDEAADQGDAESDHDKATKKGKAGRNAAEIIDKQIARKSREDYLLDPEVTEGNFTSEKIDSREFRLLDCNGVGGRLGF